MYDDDEEIRKKRRNLILIIVVIVAIIVLLIFLLIFKTSSAGKQKTKTDMKCSLKIVSGDQDSEGNYTGNVVVGFDKVSPEEDIVKKNVGVQESNRNGETYTVNKVGTVTVKGFVYNKKGEVQTCSTSVTVTSPKGACKLKVSKGTEGELDWYTSEEVTVKLESVETGNLTITKYYITEKDNEKVPDESVDTYTVKGDGRTNLVGTIEYSNGNKSTCNYEVKIDTVKPTCTLKVTSGESLGDGKYSGDVKVGFDKTEDNGSGIGTKGFGTIDDFKDEEYAFTAFETKEVVGYVMDKAGNKNSCKLKVTKAEKPSSGTGGSGSSGSGSGSSGGSGGSGSGGSGSGGSGSGGSGSGGSGSSGGYVPSGSTVVSSSSNQRMCELMVNGAKIDGKFYTGVTVSFSKVNAGLSSSNITLEGKQGADYVTIQAPSSPKSYTAYATATYNNGVTAKCNISFSIDPTLDTVSYFKNTAKFGEVVNYNPGNWNTTASMPTSGEGSLGGYFQGRSKSSSVNCKDANSVGSGSGWYIYEVGAQVKIVHAGVPICMYHASGKAIGTALNAINNHNNAAVFKDSTGLAADAYYMTIQDYSNLYAKGGAAVGQLYYLGGSYSGSSQNWMIVGTGGKNGDYYYGTLGLRPVVVLNSNVGATVSNGAWQLKVVNRAVGDDDDDSSLSERINGVVSSAISDTESLYY